MTNCNLCKEENALKIKEIYLCQNCLHYAVCANMVTDLKSYSVPIYTLQGGPGSLIGTGVLLKYNTKIFLITAAHVVDEQKNGKLFILDGLKPLILNDFCNKTTPTTNRNDDTVDIGIFVLPASAAFANFKQIEQANFFKGTTEKKPYLAMGYPANRNLSAKQTSTSMKYCHTINLTESEKNLIAPNYKDNLVLSWNTKRLTNISGTKINFCRLNGMSGSPVWLITMDYWTKNSPWQIAGILIEYYNKEKIIIVTPISKTLDLLKDLCAT